MTTLGKAEQELLAWLIDEEATDPDTPFFALRVQTGVFVAHGPVGTRKQVSDPALHRLEASGALLPRSYHEGMMQSFVLGSDASAMLEAAQEGSGAPTPLARAQERIAELEGEATRIGAQHQAAAERVGKWARRGVLGVLVVLIIGLAVWALLFSSVVPGVLAVIVAVYAVLTDAWGWTARAVAERIGGAASRRVLRYLEPGS